MKKLYFNYYKFFHCVSTKCKHNCCENWQIDIDKKSLKKYKGYAKDFFDNLSMHVDFQNACFKQNNGRCAFLDSDNLCILIKKYGEKSLCQVCADHPRIRNFFRFRMETGLSLSCEEAGRIILNENDIFLEDKDGKRVDYVGTNFALKTREKLLKSVRDFDIFSSVNFIKEFAKSKKRIEPISFTKKLLSLDILHTESVSNLCAFRKANQKTDFSLKNLLPLSKEKVWAKNLLLYLIYRHCSENIGKKQMMCRAKYVAEIFTYIIYMYAYKKGFYENPFDCFVDVCREYSTEIEYSCDNLFELYDYFEEELFRENILEE